MQIAGLNTNSLDSLRDMVSDVLGAPDKSTNVNTTGMQTNFLGSIPDQDSTATQIHQLLGNKMTQVNTVV